MKPEGWDMMGAEEKKQEAMALYRSKRGWFLLGQALAVAIETMKKEEHPAVSDIQDLEMLQELFFPYHMIGAVKKAAGKERGDATS